MRHWFAWLGVAVAEVACWGCTIYDYSYTTTCYRYRNATASPVTLFMAQVTTYAEIAPGQEWEWVQKRSDGQFSLTPLEEMDALVVQSGEVRIAEERGTARPGSVFDIASYEETSRDGSHLYLQFVFTDAYFGRE